MRKPLLFLLGLLGSGFLTQAQQRDPSFHNPSFLNGAAAAVLGTVVQQADGRYLVSGSFTTVDGHSTHSVARLMANGQPDETFRSPRLGQGAIGRLAVQADGRVLAWADSVRPLVRLLPSGVPDPTFVLDTSAALGPRLRRFCSAIAVQPDGKIVVAGLQTLVRLNSDGSRDASFQSPTLSADMYVKGVSLEPTGGLTYVTASPQQYNRVTIDRLNADGTPDASFTAQTLPRSDADRLVRQPDGRYLIGGFFGYSSQRSISLLRLLPNGAIDSSVVGGPIGTNITIYYSVGPVRALAVQADGRILVGGNGMFGSSGGVSALLRCTSDGQFDTTFDDVYIYTARTFTGIPGYVYNGAYVSDLLVESSGKVMVAGGFQQVGGMLSAGLTRLLVTQALAAAPTAAAGPAVQAWPNPAREQLALRFEGTPPRRVTLLDATGRAVLSAAGAPALSWRTAGLARGLYVLRCDYEGRTASQRVVLE